MCREEDRKENSAGRDSIGREATEAGLKAFKENNTFALSV
jgi:hypothetical protein